MQQLRTLSYHLAHHRYSLSQLLRYVERIAII